MTLSIRDRIDAMASLPMTFALTREGYLMQLWVLLEISGIEDQKIRDLAIKLYSPFNHRSTGADLLTDDFAAEAIAGSRKLLDAHEGSNPVYACMACGELNGNHLDTCWNSSNLRLAASEAALKKIATDEYRHEASCAFRRQSQERCDCDLAFWFKP